MNFLLNKCKDDLEETGFTHIPGHHFYALLIDFGASPADLDRLEEGNVHKHVMRDREESMSFRQVSFHRVLMNKIVAKAKEDEEEEDAKSYSVPGLIDTDNDASSFGLGHSAHSVSSNSLSLSQAQVALPTRRRLSLALARAGSVASSIGLDYSAHSVSSNSCSLSLARAESVTNLSTEEIVSETGGVKRSGIRKWNLPPSEYVESTVSEAIARFLDFLQPREHDDQNNTLNTESKVTINDQILIRVNKAVDVDLKAEPTPEGIHQDATEISSVTLIGRDNVARDHGGESRIWTLDQPTGTYKSQSFGDSNSNLNGFSWDKCLFNKALESPWETILFNDRKVKHEVREFFSQDKNKPSHRDVIVNFVRKPLLSGDDVFMVNGKEESIV